MPVFRVIKNYNFLLGLWEITEECQELKKLIWNDLTEKEKETANKAKEKRCKEFLAVRLLLKHLLGAYEEIKYDEFGKPFLSDKKISVSHSKNFAAVMISAYNCATDIEKTNEKINKIARKFLSVDELKMANTTEFKTLFWSAKETAYKFYGKRHLDFRKNLKIKGLSDRHLSLVIEKENLFLNLRIKFEKINDYFLTYCNEREDLSKN